MSGGQWPEAGAVTIYRGPEPFNGERPIEDASVEVDEFDPRDLSRSKSKPRTLSVVVGSDDPFTRHAFRTGASAPGITVLGAGTLAAVSRQLAQELEPDIVLLDVQTAAAEALAAIQEIRARAPGARILACSAPAGNEFGMLCLSAGAGGYISKELELGVLPRLLRALADGEAVIPRALGTELVSRFVRSSGAPGKQSPTPLSPPERRLLELLRTGQTLSEAAAELGITLATARRHFGSARRKLASHRASPQAADEPSSRPRTNSPEVL